MKIKSAMDLIEFAKGNGLTVGRRMPGVYYVGSSDGTNYSEAEYKGTYQQFAKHVINICERAVTDTK